MQIKKFIFSILCVLSLSAGFLFCTMPETYAMRMDDGSTYRELSKMDGDWYNGNGDLVLSIHDGYINSCQVLGGYDFAGGSSRAHGKFLIAESDGTRYLFLKWDLWSNPNTIQFNGETLYRY